VAGFGVNDVVADRVDLRRRERRVITISLMEPRVGSLIRTCRHLLVDLLSSCLLEAARDAL